MFFSSKVHPVVRAEFKEATLEAQAKQVDRDLERNALLIAFAPTLARPWHLRESAADASRRSEGETDEEPDQDPMAGELLDPSVVAKETASSVLKRSSSRLALSEGPESVKALISRTRSQTLTKDPDAAAKGSGQWYGDHP